MAQQRAFRIARASGSANPGYTFRMELCNEEAADAGLLSGNAMDVKFFQFDANFAEDWHVKHGLE